MWDFFVSTKYRKAHRGDAENAKKVIRGNTLLRFPCFPRAVLVFLCVSVSLWHFI